MQVHFEGVPYKNSYPFQYDVSFQSAIFCTQGISITERVSFGQCVSLNKQKVLCRGGLDMTQNMNTFCALLLFG